MYPAPVNPEMTTRTQKNLLNLLVVDQYTSPWIVEDSENSLKLSIKDIFSLCKQSRGWIRIEYWFMKNISEIMYVLGN